MFENYYKNLDIELKKYFKILSKDFPSFLIPYIETKTMMRLNNISFFCAMEYGNKELYQFKYYISRLTHSISTSLIVWNFTKDKKQTLAALFHDAGTPATSHVIDYLNNDYLIQESTEKNLEKIILKDKEILSLLNKDELTIKDVTNFKKYPLVDNKRPKLCADRLDGIFFASLSWAKNIDLFEIEQIYNNIYIIKNEDQEDEYSFKEIKYAKHLIKLNDKFNELTNDILDYNSMQILSNIIRYLINQNIIKYNDLYILDDHLLFKIIKEESIKDKILNDKLNNFINLNNIVTKDIPKLKQRNLNPLINKKRYFNNFTL